MDLNFNFNGLTKLREWWKIVLSNFKIIQEECNSTRKIAQNACTKEEAQGYVAEFAQSSPEYVEAINEFSQAYEAAGGSAQALDELYGGRLLIRDDISDADSALINENGIYTNITQNIPDNKAPAVIIMLSGIEYLLLNDGDIMKRDKNHEWINLHDGLNEKIDEIRGDMGNQIVFGTYSGDGTTDRFFDLGFTPRAVEVFKKDGSQVIVWADQYYHYGGFAVSGGNCETYAGVLLSISEVDYYIMLKHRTWENNYLYDYSDDMEGISKYLSD
ncbi:MAG: hypothetical protein PUF72_08175 [Clostridiales bacterium]|nr:hypothetical protein [Clostridiales bacterium]